MVTVASRCRSSSAMGLPTMSLRPMTTARLPADRDLLALEQLHDARAACTARSAARPWTSRPTFCGWKPSTSLSGSIASNTRCAVGLGAMAAGSGDCTRMPSHRRIRLSVSTSARTSVERRGRRPACGSVDEEPGFAAGPILVADVDCDAGSSPTSTMASAGGRPARDVKRGTANSSPGQQLAIRILRGDRSACAIRGNQACRAQRRDLLLPCTLARLPITHPLPWHAVITAPTRGARLPRRELQPDHVGLLGRDTDLMPLGCGLGRDPRARL